MTTETYKINGNDIQVTRIDNDINGNPRFVVHYLSLGLQEYESTKQTRAVGLRRYKAKQYGGGFVFSSYNMRHDLTRIINKLKD